MQRVVKINISRFDWKDIIQQRVANSQNINFRWIEIISINGESWEDIAHFPQYSAQVSVTFVNIEDVLISIEDNIELMNEIFDKYKNILTRNEIISKYYQLAMKIYPANMMRDIKEQICYVLKIESIPQQNKTDWKVTKEEMAMCDFFATLIPDSKMVSAFKKKREIKSWSMATEFKQLSQIFDAFQVSEICPVVSWNGFWKFYSSPEKDWKFTNSAQMIECKLYQMGEYYHCIVQLRDSNLEWLIENFEDEFQSPERLPELFGFQLNDALVDETKKVGGECYILNTTFTHVIFAHFLLLTAPFKKIFFFDEKIIEKSKSSVYIYCHLPGTNIIQTAHLKITNDSNVFISLKDEGQTTDSAIHVNIHDSDSPSTRTYFLQLLSILFPYMERVQSDIMAFYKNNGLTILNPKPNKISQAKSHQPGNQLLKTHVKQIFVTGYPTQCNHAPDIAEDITDDQPYLLFPSESEAKKNNVPILKYVCNHKKNPFPGVKPNKLKNKDQFPCLPCCFSIDQKKKKNSALNQWLEKGSCSKPVQVSKGILKKQQILLGEPFGNLPPVLVKVFFAVFGSLNFVRRGCGGDFVTCILRALYPTESLKTLERERQNFVKGPASEIWPVISQQLNINIWIWSATGLVRPTNAPFVDHFYNKSCDDCHIYQNFGNESNQAEEPSYELIVQIHSDKTWEPLILEQKSEVFVELAQKIWAFQAGATLFNPIRFSDESQILQKVDNFTKQRGIQTKQQSSYQEWIQIKKLAREILWNGIWLLFEKNATDIRLHIKFGSVNFEPSANLPNGSLIQNEKLIIPMKHFEPNLIDSICQTINQMQPQEQPHVIPNYYQNLSDFKKSNNSFLSMTCFCQKMPNERDAIDRDIFWIKLDGQMWIATQSKENPTINANIWVWQSEDKYILNPSSSSQASNWLVSFNSGKKIWFVLKKNLFNK